MMVPDIRHSTRFKKRYDVLDARIKDHVKKALRLFVENPLHPSLRLHRLSGKLNGYWSISINRKYRIILEKDEEFVVLVSVGTHAIYEKI